MAIDNTPKITDDELVNEARKGIAGRAQYMYYLIEGAQQAGLPIDFAYKAIYKWGDDFLNNPDFKPTTTKEIAEDSLTEFGNKVWENEITYTDDEVRIRMHHCPLMTGWMQCTDDPEKLRLMCDIAMEADVPLFTYDGFEYSLDECKTHGDAHCDMVIRKKK